MNIPVQNQRQYLLTLQVRRYCLWFCREEHFSSTCFILCSDENHLAVLFVYSMLLEDRQQQSWQLEERAQQTRDDNPMLS